MKKIILLLLILISLSCKKEEPIQKGTPNASAQYSVCNSALSACVNSTGDYCLFGFKWGADSVFVETGSNAKGPKSPGGLVTFSFQERNGSVNTHRQVGLQSRSFDELMSCAKTEIRNALDTWAASADINFEELPENSDSDIRFFVADIVQTGVGYPNYLEAPCDAIQGTMVIRTNNSIGNCKHFYLFALHELGHILGLGHVETRSVMNPHFWDFNFNDLQAGDRIGITQIYGEK
ncbi:MAG: matrixin family metalloprotease [Bacteroidota bacterium]